MPMPDGTIFTPEPFNGLASNLPPSVRTVEKTIHFGVRA
jgi:hypothetical protein